jgi:ribulose 1,5-bisphosphate synthetase/thiazole synthase
MKNQTRRDFLACSGIGALGMMAGIPAVAANAAEENSTSGNDTYLLSREIPVGDTYDLVVAGGGPAGTAAAVCAARLGAKVLLVEATGCLGGAGTSGLVTAFDPMANGEQMVVGGLMREIVETLYQRNFLQPGIDPDSWRKKLHVWTPFQVEGYKLVLDELAVAAGVRIHFFTKVIDVDADIKQGKINGVIIHNIEGYRYIKAKTFVDGTGDAVLADLCKVKCREAGVDTPRIMPPTLCSLFAGINWTEFRKKNQHQALYQAIEEGHFAQRDRHLPGMSKVNHTVGYLNGGHIYNLNALRCKDLTDGMIFGRKLAQEYLSFYKKYMPGCENLQHVVTAEIMGIRESRRIVGEYELNIGDYIARRKFPDQIGIFCKFVDVHAYDASDVEWKRFTEESGAQVATKGELEYNAGEFYGIPYGILVPKGWKNLWVAGKTVSTDVKVQGSLRVQPACSMMGQAAGTAAVQSVKTGQPANDLDTETLVKTLREAGAYLPQETLSKKMTRV